MTSNDEFDAEMDVLRQLVTEADLGPAEASVIGDGDGIRFELDHGILGKAAVLQRWLHAINPIDVIAGTYHAADPVLRLNLRGTFPDGQMVVVVAPFDRQVEQQQVALISERINRKAPEALVDLLVTLEQEVTQ